MTLRWGLLGTARINRRLIPAIRASARSVIAAVGSRNRVRADAYAREWSIARAFGSYEALLGSDVDIIYNALPNSLHVPWTLAAIAAGKHVLCEKPLGLTAAGVDLVTTEARAANVVVTEGFMYRHHAQTAAMLAAIRGDAIGEVRSVASGFSYRRDRPDDVRTDPALGGGALWDIGCYPVSLAQLIAGTPARVAGLARTGATGVDEEFAGTLIYGDGVIAQISASFTASYQAYLRIAGTRGTMTVDHPFRPEPVERIRIERDDRVETITVHGHAIFVDEITDMEAAVLGTSVPRLSLAESRTHAATLAALHESARTGRCVSLA